MPSAATFDSPSEFNTARAVDVLPDPKHRGSRRLLGRRSKPTAPAPQEIAAHTGRRLSDLIPAQPADGGSDAPAEILAGRDRLLVQIADVLNRQAPTHALVQFGVDGFRQLVERSGADAAEAALRRVGIILTWVFPGHQVTRIDGACFAALFPFDGLAGAQAQIDRCLALVAATDLSDDGAGIRATASAGITVLDRPGLTPDGVLVEADLALAEARRPDRDVSADDRTDPSGSDAMGRFRRALKMEVFALQTTGAK